MRFKLHHSALTAAAVSLALLLSHAAHAAPVANPLQREASIAVHAEGRVLLGLTRAGSSLVAVGERGLVLLSDDNGSSWRQVKVPVAVTLTAARFPTPKSGWAVGHAGVVLHTEDGGETWVRQLDGKAIGNLLSEAAKASASAQMSAVAQQFVRDGADKPFLDLHFFDERSGILVGAYGLILRTEDAGKSWQPMMDRVDNPKGLHIYAIAVRGDSIWLAGEQGFLAHSANGGKTFARIETPYRGSYFTLAAPPDGSIVIGGLKGNAFRSADGGAHFDKLEGFFPVSLSASAVLADGKIVFTNQAGQLFVSDKQGREVRLVPQMQAAPLAAVAQAANDNIVVAGVRGIASVPGGITSSVPGASK